VPPLDAPHHSACAVHDLGRRDVLADAARLCPRPLGWWLDSALEGSRLGRFSFLGADPWLVVRAWGSRVEIECRRAVAEGFAPGVRRVAADPLAALRALLPRPPARDPAPELPFLGGAVGFFGYELAAGFEPLRGAAGGDLFTAPADTEIPDLCFLFVDRLVAVDHGAGRSFAVGLGLAADDAGARARAGAAARALTAELAGARRAAAGASGPGVSRGAPACTPEPGAALDESAHAKAVARIQEHIEAGDLYQACLTLRLEVPFAGDPFRLYHALRRRAPAPFAAWLALPEVAVLSSSPERFLCLRGDRRVESRPIKGTRPRGREAAGDARLAAELRASAKDRAENLMIVDLVRNDLGRVCETGSVGVPELFAVESYAAVHQMVSTVEGRLRADRDVFDLVRAAFPPGSMTGAPKLAAMRLLARLEPDRRGIYSGALGYLDLRGGADLSVVIRTVLARRGRVALHTGGGIVADSDPAAEWRESADKVRPLLEALALAGLPGAPARTTN
jgi:para-aminobenzoate synthetase component 1